MQMIRLKNGREEPEPLVNIIWGSLEGLWNSKPDGFLVVSDLVKICRRDPKYRKYNQNEEKLKTLGLLQNNGQPTDSVRNIVLSSFTGNGLGLKFCPPAAK